MLLEKHGIVKEDLKMDGMRYHAVGQRETNLLQSVLSSSSG
jgi:hypothetical protein